jgi:OOP family OmpA-OmpF porin
MKKPPFALAFVLSFASAFPALAQAPFPPPPAPGLSGPYVGGLLGRSRAKQGCVGVLAGGGRSCDDTDPAYGLFAGYQLNRYFAAEAGYADLGKLRASSVATTVDTHAWLWEAAALGFVPVADRFALYGKFGGYRATLQSSERGLADRSNGGVTYGGGLEWGLRPGLGLRGQWQRYKDVGGDLVYGENTYDVLSAALLWRWR